MLTQLLSEIILGSIVLTPAMANEPARKFSWSSTMNCPTCPARA